MALLDSLHRELGWPGPEEVYTPSGVGAQVLVHLASEKLGKAIARLPGGAGVTVGVLAAEPDATDAPLALICRFPNAVPEATLREAQKLAWNFSRSLLLITIEPHIIRKWSCCEVPSRNTSAPQKEVIPAEGPEIHPAIAIDTDSQRLDLNAAKSLWWVELVSGHFFEEYQQRFPQDQRADHMLLSNLKAVRALLRQAKLPDSYSHDLLARIIFVQFLFDRKDSSGAAALNARKLNDLYEEGILSSSYDSLAAILTNYQDTYALFRWLNRKFNGDLFPGKGVTEQHQELGWGSERMAVKPHHLNILADFVRGDINLMSGQLCLWPQYAFDAIPLEFISSIYEEFVSNSEGIGIHYTRGHVVDLMLDRVLPWQGDQWDLSILDPACGSGIFLVKAFQRLIYRWKSAHSGQEIHADVLRRLLQNNLFGVDKDPDAVRVASFSLYLAMCDEIDPRHYWADPEVVHFPPLRGERIIVSDFFAEDVLGFRTEGDAGRYDIVIGNPPWGDKTALSSVAAQWAAEHDWPIANKDFGVLFVVKSTALTKDGGFVCMIQSASALLYNRELSAQRLRRKVFTETVRVEGVINLANLKLFHDVRVPTCIIILQREPNYGEQFWYICPKQQRTIEDLHRIFIDPQDVNFVRGQDVVDDPWIWSALMWGGNRDINLVRKLKLFTSLNQYKSSGVVVLREGINRGDRKTNNQGILGRRILFNPSFPNSHNLRMMPHQLPINSDSNTHSRDSSDLTAFQNPQLLIKSSWVRNVGRFQARMVDDSENEDGVVCSQSFVSVHAEAGDRDLLMTACLSYNSSLATYYLLMTSGRFAFDRAEPLVQELSDVPIPTPSPHDTVIVASQDSPDALDEEIFRRFGLQEAERILLKDAVQYTLPDYKRLGGSPSRKPTSRHGRTFVQTAEPELTGYCSEFHRVLATAYGQDKKLTSVIYSETNNDRLPVRMVSIRLNATDRDKIIVYPLLSTDLQRRLVQINELQEGGKGERTGFVYGRCLRTYEAEIDAGQQVLVVNLIKPDQKRFWTRSMALRDADDVAGDLMTWANASGQAEGTGLEVIIG